MTVVLFSSQVSKEAKEGSISDVLTLRAALMERNWVYLQNVLNSIKEPSPHFIISASLGNGALLSMLNGMGVSGYQSVMTSISGSLQKIQNIVNQLTRGDISETNQHLLKNSFVSEVQSAFFLLNEMSASVRSTEKLHNSLIRGDLDSTEIQSLYNSIISEVSSLQPLINEISTSHESIHKLVTVVADAHGLGVEVLMNSMLYGVSGNQSILGAMGEFHRYYSVDYEIYLDGMPIKHRITSANISCDQGSVHDTIDFSSLDRQLFFHCDPFVAGDYGTPRIEVHVGARVMNFLLETREGDEQNFSIWGRSLSALNDRPYAETTSYVLENDTLISEIAEDVIPGAIVDWDTIDWTVRSEWNFQGYPLDGLSELADIAGQIVRSRDDGTLVVRDKFSVRPKDLPTAKADVDYDRETNIIRLSMSEDYGTNLNVIDVDGYSQEIFLPDLSVEEPEDGELAIGDDCYVRAYWAGKKPNDTSLISYIATDGNAEVYEEDVVEEMEEIVHFENKSGSVSNPIDTDDIQVTWYGNDGGELTIPNSHGTDLNCEADFAVGVVKYKTKYDRYRLFGHNVLEMLFAVYGMDPDAINLTVKLDVDDIERKATDVISSDFITTEAVAIHAAMNWFDDNYYNATTITLSVPYDDNARDGNLAYINNAEIGCTGTYLIRRADIVFEGPKVTNELEVYSVEQHS